MSFTIPELVFSFPPLFFQCCQLFLGEGVLKKSLEVTRGRRFYILTESSCSFEDQKVLLEEEIEQNSLIGKQKMIAGNRFFG